MILVGWNCLLLFLMLGCCLKFVEMKWPLPHEASGLANWCTELFASEKCAVAMTTSV